MRLLQVDSPKSSFKMRLDDKIFCFRTEFWTELFSVANWRYFDINLLDDLIVFNC